MGILGIGAGASEGLDTYLARLLAQQQVDQRGQAQQETVRSNMADEAYRLKALDANNQTRLEVAKGAQKDRETAQQNTEAARVGKNLDELPPGTPLDPSARQSYINLKAITPEQAPYTPPSMGKTDPTQPAGQEEVGASAGGFRLVGSNASRMALRRIGDTEQNQGVQQELAGVRNDIAQQRADAAQNKPQNDHFTAIPHYDPTGKQIGTYRFNTATGTMEPIEGADNIRPNASGDAKQKDAQGKALGLINALGSQIDEASAKGMIGPLAGRVYRDFMAGKVGTTGNPDADRLLGGILANTTSFSPLVALGVGEGARGAAGTMGKRWDALVEGSASKDLLHGSLDEMKRLLSGEQQQQPGQGTTAPASTGKSAYQLYLERTGQSQ